ncbi:MAG TPA: excinuclease ABC subunit UvrC [Bacteroidia bacterium]|nr:excinuclease ABC subunit UvrC [Bacteroidia bacterium]
MNPHLQSILSSLPDKPGIYQYFDKRGTIIYIGKAKSLRKRVSSYFHKNHEYGKILYLVKSIADIKFIVVETEYDALLLENNLIKKYQPRYNVALKDDKTFPWICIKKEPFPRIFSTRRVIRDGSEYFGPYASVRMMHTLLDFIHRLFPLRNCNLNLTQANIAIKKFRVCLEYHIGNCKGPCEAFQSVEDYDQGIAQIRHILKGNLQSVIQYLKETMKKFSDEMNYEEAQNIKEKILLLENYQSKSVVAHPSIKDADVFSFKEEDNHAFVNYLRIINGAIIQSFTMEMKKKLDEPPAELLPLAIAELRTRFDSHAPELIIPFEIEMEIPEVEITVPKIGDKKHLISLSEKNLGYYLRERALRTEASSPKRKTERILEQAKIDLRLKAIPFHIECFDNSNIQGTFPVAAMSVMKNGKPSKRDYRHFNIKTVEGPDDFASMEEVIHRRYKRMLDEKIPLPQLIVIDGGKGQLSSALTSLKKLSLENKIEIISIAKKLEEIFRPGDSIPLYIDKKSETLRMIQRLRDEAHRFGIEHHRSRRTKGVVKTELSEIKGIGEKISEKLLKKFRSVQKVRQASLEDLSKVIGAKKAEAVFRHFVKK